MIKLPSQSRPYTEHWSEDPAFEQPPTSPSGDTDEPTRKAHKDAVDAYLLKLKNATDTGDWSSLRVQGSAEPARFSVRLIPPDALGKLGDMSAAGVGENELAVLAFRIALLDVNIDGVKVGKVNDDRFGRIASIDWLAGSGGAGVRLMCEIGLRVFLKSSAVRPFS